MRYDLDKRLKAIETKAKELGHGFECILIYALDDGRYISIGEKNPKIFSSEEEIDECYKDLNGTVIIDEWAEIDLAKEIAVAKLYR